MVVTRGGDRRDYSALHNGDYIDVLTGRTSAEKKKKAAKKSKKQAGKVPTSTMSGTEGSSPITEGAGKQGQPQETPNKQIDEPQVTEPSPVIVGEPNKDGDVDVTAELSGDELARRLDEADQRNALLRRQKEDNAKRQRLLTLLAQNKSLEADIAAAKPVQGAKANRVMPPKSKQAHSAVPVVVDPDVTIQDVRRDPGVKKSVKSTLQLLGMDSETETETESKLKSRGKGMSRKSRPKPITKWLESSSDSEDEHSQNKVLWPHESLGPKFRTFGSASTKYNNLDNRLFIAGELNIIRASISDIEKIGRLNLLCDTVFNMGHYEWQAILRLHATILSEIESGSLTWKSDFSRLEQQLLMPYTIRKANLDKKSSKNKAGGKSDKVFHEDKILYCNEFQSGTCDNENESHNTKFFGRSATVHHICAACFKHTNKKQRHPANSTNCPFYDN